jgi:hypothetical protein
MSLGLFESKFGECCDKIMSRGQLCFKRKKSRTYETTQILGEYWAKPQNIGRILGETTKYWANIGRNHEILGEYWAKPRNIGRILGETTK